MIHVFRLLARFKFLRGTAFDPFGCRAERKAERRQIEDHSRYEPAGGAAISLRSSSAGNTSRITAVRWSRWRRYSDDSNRTASFYFSMRAMVGLRNHRAKSLRHSCASVRAPNKLAMRDAH